MNQKFLHVSRKKYFKLNFIFTKVLTTVEKYYALDKLLREHCYCYSGRKTETIGISILTSTQSFKIGPSLIPTGSSYDKSIQRILDSSFFFNHECSKSQTVTSRAIKIYIQIKRSFKLLKWIKKHTHTHTQAQTRKLMTSNTDIY